MRIMASGRARAQYSMSVIAAQARQREDYNPVAAAEYALCCAPYCRPSNHDHFT